MRTRHCVVFICALFVAGVGIMTTMAADLIIDDCHYADSQAAGRAWSPEDAAFPAEVATLDGVTCVRLPCEFRGDTVRAFWNKLVKLDLSAYDHFTLRFKAEDWTAVRMLSLWFRCADDQWYGKLAIANITSNGWQEIVIPKSAFGDTYGVRAGWNDIRAIRIAVWQGHLGKTSFAIADFRAQQSAEPVNLLPNSSFEVCTTERLPDYWGSGQWGIITPQWVTNAAGWRVRWGVDDGVSHSGKRSLRIVGSTNPGDLRAMANWTCLEPKPYTLSAWMKSDRDALPVTLDIPSAGSRAVNVDTQWKRYSITGSPKQTVVSCSIFPTAEGTVWIDDVQLETGTEASDWHPARVDHNLSGLAVHRGSPELSPVAIRPGPNRTQVKIDRHRRVLVNGKPFIPFAYLPWGNPSEAELHLVARAGFNSIVFHAIGNNSLEQVRTVLDQAHQNGLKVILWMGHNVQPDQMREWVTGLKKHPALLAWYVYDEPASITPQVRERYDIAHSLDPAHPAFINYVLYPRDNLGDIASLDYYPIPNSPPLGIAGEAATLERSASKAGKPSWIWLQSCGNAFFAAREPTGPEEECMVYLSLIHGVRGLQFFAYIPRSVELWNTLQRLAREVETLTPILSSVGKPRPATALSSAIHLVVKRYHWKTYLIAVNSTAVPVDATIQIPGARGRAVVLFENRVVKLSKSSFLDHFEGYQRHVYRLP